MLLLKYSRRYTCQSQNHRGQPGPRQDGQTCAGGIFLPGRHCQRHEQNIAEGHQADSQANVQPGTS